VLRLVALAWVILEDSAKKLPIGGWNDEELMVWVKNLWK
jgi:hypothetical protein